MSTAQPPTRAAAACAAIPNRSWSVALHQAGPSRRGCPRPIIESGQDREWADEVHTTTSGRKTVEQRPTRNQEAPHLLGRSAPPPRVPGGRTVRRRRLRDPATWRNRPPGLQRAGTGRCRRWSSSVFLGLPVALALSWVFDLTPEGLKRTRSLVPVGSASMMPRVALLVVTTVSLGLGAFWFSRSAMSGSDAAGPRDRTRPRPPVSPASTPTPRSPRSPSSPWPTSPRATTSSPANSTTRSSPRLSELTSLRVVSRTSVERYRTTDKLLPRSRPS